MSSIHLIRRQVKQFEEVEVYEFRFLNKYMRPDVAKIEIVRVLTKKELHFFVVQEEIARFNYIDWVELDAFIQDYKRRHSEFKGVGAEVRDVMKRMTGRSIQEIDFSEAYQNLCLDLSLLTKDKEWFQEITKNLS